MEESSPALEALRECAQAVYLRLGEAFGLPGWDNPSPPLDELVNTILSQNTNDRNRDLAYTSPLSNLGSRA
jgi:endonuclease III